MILISILSLTMAWSAPACEDLGSSVCKPASVTDSTGTADNTSNHILKRAFAFIKEYEPTFKKDLELAMRKKPSIYQHAMGVSTRSNPACKYPQGLQNPKCVSEAANLIWPLIMPVKNEVPEQNVFENIDLNGLNPLLFDPEVVSVQNAAKKKMEDFILKETKPAADRASGAFKEIKKRLTEKLRSSLPDSHLSQKMVNQLKEVEWGGIECRFAEDKQTFGNSLFTPNAYFHFEKKKFFICPGLLQANNSQFNLAAIIAHELSHSIDFCAVQSGFTFDPDKIEVKPKDQPYANLLSCLRSGKSVGAKPGKDNSICKYDEANEAFCDWMSAQVLPEYMQDSYLKEKNQTLTKDEYRTGYSNVYRGFSCTGQKQSFGHPQTKTRINSIFLTQPKIRQQMSCSKPPAKYRQCSNDSAQTSSPIDNKSNLQRGTQ